MLKFKIVCSSCDRSEWIDAVEWDGHFYCECNDPDYAVADYEGNVFGQDFAELSEEFVSAGNDDEREQFWRYLNHYGGGSTLDRMLETYMGLYTSAGAFADQTLRNEADSLPNWARYNINWEGVAHDLRNEFEFVDHPCGVEVYTY